MIKRRILVAMSGGVDSATTAALLKEEGYDVVGVTMQLWDYGDAEGGCCSADEVRDARRVADQIRIPHYVVNYMDLFKKYIVGDFIRKYQSGQTPIPCVLCNQIMKFDFLLKRALELGADVLATGHYARVERDEQTGGYHLEKAIDRNKDQTYFLFTLKQRELRRIIFPLGNKKKSEVREIADGMDLKVSKKPESMDVCFIAGGNYREFLKDNLNKRHQKGEIVDLDGNVLAEHEGISSFTVGQRRGLGIAKGRPMYVVKVVPEENRVIVGEEKDLFSTKLVAGEVSWVEHAPLEEIDVSAKIRNRHEERESIVKMISETEALVEFNEPQRAITPGQAIVFYNGERVLGGGWIKGVAR